MSSSFRGWEETIPVPVQGLPYLQLNINRGSIRKFEINISSFSLLKKMACVHNTFKTFWTPHHPNNPCICPLCTIYRNPPLPHPGQFRILCSSLRIYGTVSFPLQYSTFPYLNGNRYFIATYLLHTQSPIIYSYSSSLYIFHIILYFNNFRVQSKTLPHFR